MNLRQLALAGNPLEHGKVVQVELMISMSKAPGTERLKLKPGDLLLNVATNFNLRRYSTSASSTPSYACPRSRTSPSPTASSRPRPSPTRTGTAN